MLRLAPAAGWILGWSLVSVLSACSAPPAPAPSKLSETKNTIQEPMPRKRDEPSPFMNPNKEPPPPRSEPQLPADEVTAAIASAEAARKINDNLETSLALRPCANKVPQSVQCEGELAIVLVKMPRHPYEADYYLKQAIAADDPALTADYYRRLGDALQRRSMTGETVTAYERMISRATPPTAEDYNLLAVALQALPSRLADAVDALSEAYALDGARHEWLRDQAILLGQMPDKIAQSIARFQEFKQKTTDPALIADTDRRIAELQALLAAGSGPLAPKKPAKPRKPKPAATPSR